MDRDDVNRWLDAYVSAWKSYDRDEIGALFSDDVEYRYHPYNDAIRGRAEVVESWRGEGDHGGAPTRDEPGTYDASYRVVALDGDVAVATGTSTYTEPDAIYDNCFVMRFADDGRCREFTEWVVERPR
jgi:hypothetical protein